MTNFSDISADPLYLTAQLTAAPSRNSVAVLPFVDMSGEAGHEHFTDGLTEDIITDLSNVPGFFVIARNSTFAYKGKPTDVRQIAHDLGVRYVLEGSARRSDKRLRINVQLIDAAEGGKHVWAERFDRDLADIFVVQDEVTRRIVEAISGKLSVAPGAERYKPSNLTAYDLCVRSRNLWSLSEVANSEAHANLSRAIALDPDYAEAHWRLAIVQLFTWTYWAGEEEHNRRNALRSAEKAAALDRNDSSALWVLGYVLLHERRWDEAQASYDASLLMNPNDADAYAVIADFKYMTGNPREGLDSIAIAFRLNPHPPGWYYWILGYLQVANGQYENAVATLRRDETYRSVSRRALASVLALQGNIEEAMTEARHFMATNPNWRIGRWHESQPFKNPGDAELWVKAMKLAGFPE